MDFHPLSIEYSSSDFAMHLHNYLARESVRLELFACIIYPAFSVHVAFALFSPHSQKPTRARPVSLESVTV